MNEPNQTPLNARRDGAAEENVAARFLESRGYRILERNFFTRFGEIDIVAKEGETVVFVEVKTRRTALRGSPEEALTARKRDAMVRAAVLYVQKHGLVDVPLRFDAVLKFRGRWRVEKNAVTPAADYTI